MGKESGRRGREKGRGEREKERERTEWQIQYYDKGGGSIAKDVIMIFTISLSPQDHTHPTTVATA